MHIASTPPAISTPSGRHSLRTRILAISLVPSLSLMLVGLGSAVYTGYRGYQTTSESGKYSSLSGNAGDTQERASVRSFLQELRTERQLTGEVLGDANFSTAGLAAQWAKSDAAADVMARASSQPVVSQRELQTLRAVRPKVMARTISLVDAIDSYSSVIVEADSRDSTSLARVVVDPRVVREDEISQQLSALTEALQVSGALSFSAFSGAGMSSDAFREFTYQTGTFQQLLTTLQGALPSDEAADLNRLTTGTTGDIVAVAQRSILHGSTLRAPGTAGQTATTQAPGAGGPEIRIEDARVVATLPTPLADWNSATAQLSAGLVALQDQHLVYSAGIARQVGTEQLRTALFGSLALLLFAIVVLAVSLAVSRRLIGRLQRLRQDTIALSHDRLPALVQRLREGQPVDVKAELPSLDYGPDEIGQVAEAFGQAQRTAVSAAAREAETRAGLRTVFLGIARRSQAIVHRQLKVLDQAERGQEDPDQLELLFQLDHLSTRSRRNAENLIILAGGQTGRRWRNAVSLRQLVRGSMSEAEDYTRVSLGEIPDITVTGAVVADLIHLLAELIDNATSFSPPTSRVEVRGGLVGRGLAIDIEDQGIGIDQDQMERLNQMLLAPPNFEVMALADEPRLGLFVVARLAARHGIRVTLTVSLAYGGTKVVVLVPSSLVLGEDHPPELPGLVALPAPEGAMRTTPVRPSLTPVARPMPRVYDPLPPVASPPVHLPPPAVTAPVPFLSPAPELGRSVPPAHRHSPEPDAPSGSPGETWTPLVLPGDVQRRPPVGEGQWAASASPDGSRGPRAVDRPELPRRTQQAHLSPNLRQAPQDSEVAGHVAAPVDAETARTRMSALQRGTIRGRATESEDLR